MKTLAIDIETYSDVDLGKVGVYKYVDSPNFQILLFGYSVDCAPVEVIDLKHGEEIPKEIMAALEDDSVLKTAFNAQFERVSINKFFNVDSGPWECTMIKSWYCGINGGLKSVGKAIGLSEEKQKMSVGKRLINKFCKPHKRTQKSLTDADDWELFKEYCKRDVEVEQDIRRKLSRFKIPDWEWDLYRLDQQINDNGIRLDMDMVENAIRIDEALTKKATKKYQEITGMKNPNSLPDIKNFIKEKTGETVNSINKNNMADLMYKFRGFPDVIEVLNIRKLLSKTSTAKYRMMTDIVLSDGRSRGNIQHYGANRTGRWAGRLIQVHNLPRNHLSDLDTARRAVKYGDYELLDMLYDDVPDILRQCLRTTIIPDDGKKFIVADFSAIEARVIAWFAHEDWVLDVFRSHGKIYEAAAARMFHVPIDCIDKGSDLRQRGKVATLALGYQGSVGALKSMGALKMGIPEDELQPIVDSWREANSNIVRFWYNCDNAFKTAITDGYKKLGPLYFHKEADILWIRLPSGRELAYPKPRIEPHDKWAGRDKIVFSDRNSAGTGWIDRDTYGGKIVENIVQATARDCLGYSMKLLDDAGYKIVMHVHDEVIIEIDEDAEDLNEICKIMGQEIPWAKGLPLNADGYECSYYQKD